MKRGMFLFVTILLAVCVFLSTPGTARAELKAGAGRVEITPPIGCYLGGYYAATQRTVGVHDPLNVRVLVLDDSAHKLVLITMDLVIMGGVMAGEIKDKIQQEFGIPPEYINIQATHTHTGPEGYFEEFGKYPKEYLPEMKQSFEEKTVQAVEIAMSRLAPASVGYEQLTLEDQNGNRHDPDGPVDRTAVLLVVKDAAGHPITGFLNFAAHPTVVPAGEYVMSAEWPGMFMAEMEKRMGGDAVFLYLQGASGNLGTGSHGTAMRDGKEVQLDDWGKAEDKALRLSDTLFPLLNTMPAASDIQLAATGKHYVFKVRTKKDFAQFTKDKPAMLQAIKDSDASDTLKDRRMGWINERYGVESFMSMMIPTMKRVKKGRTQTWVQAMRIGGLRLVAFPGEPITELSILLRKELGPGPVAVLGYSNDHLGYITTKEIFEQGGYEAGMGLVFPEATDEMVSGLIELSHSIEK